MPNSQKIIIFQCRFSYHTAETLYSSSAFSYNNEEEHSYGTREFQTCRINSELHQKTGDHMPDNAEIIKTAIDDFREIQRYMFLAKEENASKTYAELKEKYISLKALLNVLGVDLTDIDKIKER